MSDSGNQITISVGLPYGMTTGANANAPITIKPPAGPKNLKAHTGIAVALMVPPTEAEELAADVEGAVPAEILHLTLAYLGDVEQASLSKNQLLLAIAQFASNYGPIEGRINGRGRFDNNGVSTLWAAYTSKPLASFRQALMDYLREYGFENESEHGFQPHISLVHFDSGDPEPEIEVPEMDLKFTHIGLMWAGEYTLLPLEGGEMPMDESKALTLHERAYVVGRAFWEAYDADFWVMSIFDDHLIAGAYDREVDPDLGLYYRVEYTINGREVTFSERDSWVIVEQEYAEAKRAESTLVAPGGELKALEDGRIGGYLVKFTDPDNPDLERDFFTTSTQFGPHTKSIVFYDHGLDPETGLKSFGLAELSIKDAGVWMEMQLDLADEYERAVYEISKRQKMRASSGTAAHLVKRTPVKNSAGETVYHIDHWPLGVDASLTVRPAAGPDATRIQPLKSYVQDFQPRPLKAWLQELGDSSTADANAPGGEPDEGKPNLKAAVATEPAVDKEIDMDPEELKTLVTEAVGAAVAPVTRQVEALEGKLVALENEAPVNDPGPAVPAAAPASPASPAKSVYVGKFGSIDDAMKSVMRDLTGGDEFMQFNFDQTRAFAKYLRFGDRRLSAEEARLLDTQVFAPSHVKMFLEQGFEVREIKDTQVSVQGSLGGYAAPPMMQENIAARLPGLTAFRGNGATVITLLNSDVISVTTYTGGDDRYRGNIRGAWTGEKGDPAEKNYTTGEEDIRAYNYLYKIRMTESQLRNAANLIQLVERDIVDTLAIDEDTAFAVGDGVKKPLGILPGGTYSADVPVAQVPGGNASALTTSGIKKLKRGVPSQYREQGVFIANSDTYGDIENLTVSGTGSDFAFDSLSDNGTLLRRPAAENGSMPDVAGNAYPILFGAPRGYYIVERPGLTVQRMQDTQTSLNKSELHVMKQIGGRLVETWLFAALKVATSV